MKSHGRWILTLLLLLPACSEPTAPGVRMQAEAEGQLVVASGIAWHTLELSALPTMLDCTSREPIRGPVNVYSGGALYESFAFEASISGRMETALTACFEIEVKRKDAEQGPRVLVGPVDFAPEPGAEPLEITLEYDGLALRILP